MFSIAGTADTAAAAAAQQPDGEVESNASGSAHHEASIIAASDNVVSVPPARVVTLSSTLSTLLVAQYANAVEHMLLGKLQGRTQPSARELIAWCKKHLHATFLHMTFLGQSYFEVAFSSAEGKDETLRRSGFFLGDVEVVFSPWQPSFEPEDPACVDSFAYAIWAQFCGLNSLLRTRECLTEIGKHVGAVLAVEEDDAHRATVAGLRVRISVSTKALKTLPQRIEIPQIGSFRGKMCKVVYSGLPELCRECDTYAHSPKNCPANQDSSEPEDLKSFYSKEKGKGLKPLRMQRQTSARPEERIVFQQALSFVENPSHRDEESIMSWSEKPSFGTKSISNSQYAMTLSGPLSAPHSPSQSSGSHKAMSRWTGSSVGITPLSTKFSTRPVHAI